MKTIRKSKVLRYESDLPILLRVCLIANQELDEKISLDEIQAPLPS